VQRCAKMKDDHKTWGKKKWDMWRNKGRRIKKGGHHFLSFSFFYRRNFLHCLLNEGKVRRWRNRRYKVLNKTKSSERWCYQLLLLQLDYPPFVRFYIPRSYSKPNFATRIMDNSQRNLVVLLNHRPTSNNNINKL
jgi:hypothetical protein